MSLMQGVQQPVFTVNEVASSLRVSDETIRRKIASGEIKAIAINSGSRTTFRILGQELVRWLGADTTRQLFGIGNGLLELEKAFESLEPLERQELIENAIATARVKAPTRERVGRSVSAEDITKRFT